MTLRPTRVAPVLALLGPARAGTPMHVGVQVDVEACSVNPQGIAHSRDLKASKATPGFVDLHVRVAGAPSPTTCTEGFCMNPPTATPRHDRPA